ncbi:hypothetical protein BGZ58_009788 [Dissophora ornata]|nr:hypothetical protein BGZ58_009788 [Dissophora ornata]
MDVEGEIDKGAEKTNRLLAAILVFYKDAMINPIAPLYAPQLLQELDICLQTEPSLASQNISNGTTDLEHRSAEVALKFIDLESTTPIVDRLFYAMVNLTRPSQSFRDSIELQESSFEDIEFRSLVQRIAKKIGVLRQTSVYEQTKFR